MSVVVKVRLHVKLDRLLDVTVDCTGPLVDPSKSVTAAVVRRALHAYVDSLDTHNLRITATVTKAAQLAHVEDENDGARNPG